MKHKHKELNYAYEAGCSQKEVDLTNMQEEAAISSTVTTSKAEKDKISDSEHAEQNKAYGEILWNVFYFGHISFISIIMKWMNIKSMEQ